MIAELVCPLRTAARKLVTPKAQAVILMYHRVARVAHDPWGLAVSPERFHEQMAWLARERRVLPMAGLVAGLKGGTLPRRAVAITFDDGYLDNLTEAKPILEAHGLPATLFALAAAPGHDDGFWWDELAELILGCHAAVDATLALGGGTSVSLRWTAETEASQKSAWRAWEPPQTARQAAYLELWRLLREQSATERGRVLAALRDLLPATGQHNGRIMTEAELAQAFDGAALTLGGHGVTHSPLTTRDPSALAEEVKQSFAWCRSRHGDGVPGFAYPYGDVNGTVRDAVEAGGFAWACTTRAGTISERQDPFDLPRLAIGDWTAGELRAAMRSAGTA